MAEKEPCAGWEASVEVLDPGDLYELEAELPELAEGSVLLVSLDGFVDAGAAGRLVREQLLTGLPHRIVATFDVDQLIDYRARRPAMTFDEDHWVDYASPRLVLHLIRDDAETPFLLLTGPEPDFQWERFVAAVGALIRRFGVRLTVGFHGIPMGVPHTRPIGVTAHATRRELVADKKRWVGSIEVPGSIAGLLELRLGESGHDAAGFAVHVPHYLAQAEYPDAALVALTAVTEATGLLLPPGTLRESAEQARQEIEKQVADSEEVAEVIRALEQQYDAVAGAAERGSLLAEDGRPLPTADELGAEFERFLATQEGTEDG